MSKLVCPLGNQERVFSFVRGDRGLLEKEFCGTAEFPGLYEWVYRMVFPLDEKGKPTMGGNYAAQVAFIHAGIKQHCKINGKTVTREKVQEWLDAISESDSSEDLVLKPVTIALAAAWEYGLFGRKLVISSDEAIEEAPKDSGGSETPA